MPEEATQCMHRISAAGSGFRWPHQSGGVQVRAHPKLRPIVASECRSAQSDVRWCGCRPQTGRTHQIRSHLQHVGHPIANDCQYGGTYDGPQSTRNWGLLTQDASERGHCNIHRGQPCHCCSAKPSTRESPQATTDSLPEAQQSDSLTSAPSAEQAYRAHSPAMSEPELGMAGSESCSSEALLVSRELQDDLCPNCPLIVPKRWPVGQPALWLHAQKYSCDLWSFECPLPQWAAGCLPTVGRED